MEKKICPVCNEIRKIKLNCGKCNGNMVDKGREQEYFDDYSADDPIKDYDDYCIHIFKCNKCGFFEKKLIKKIIV
ncbi:hypothetical protein [Clostridium ganghwense]|uniref:Uncharacterized protein n=1 Tax=Clostridium ganghwense TaxID=312089 RepID=A0ABT4CN40_9CLOT|nr:hypothetical protein [Clostridium ganghwense]MCY6370477.1 hypothetical protein [Clostridium ganghwense]